MPPPWERLAADTFHHVQHSKPARRNGGYTLYGYAMPPVTRTERADHARVHIHSSFNAKQRAFLEFVLSHYISVGVEELDQQKLTPLLRLKYGAIKDAIADLGRPEEIGQVFAGFQKYLYTKEAA